MNSTFFSKRLKLIRLAHNLKGNTLGALIGAPGNGSIGKLEKGKSQPSFTPLTGIAEFFAIDLEWLVGRVNDPYREEIISYEEKNLFPIYANVENKLIEILPYQDFLPLPEDYVDLTLRKKTYSLALRADIIFLSRYLKYMIETEPDTWKSLSEYLPIIFKAHSENKLKNKRSLSIPETIRERMFNLIDESLFFKYYYWLYRIWYVEKLNPINQQSPIFNIMVSKEQ